MDSSVPFEWFLWVIPLLVGITFTFFPEKVFKFGAKFPYNCLSDEEIDKLPDYSLFYGKKISPTVEIRTRKASNPSTISSLGKDDGFVHLTHNFLGYRDNDFNNLVGAHNNSLGITHLPGSNELEN